MAFDALGNKVLGRNFILTLALAAVCTALLLRPAELDPPAYIGFALGVTAWIAFGFFVVAYVAQPIRKIFCGNRWLLAQRRYFGLAAALVHTIHFGYVVVYVCTTSEVVEPVTYVGAGIAFALLWFMALTSNDVSMRVLGPWWKRIHKVGMHYLWFIFALTFSGGIGTSWISTLLFVACLLALALRFWASRLGRGERGKHIPATP